METGDHSVRLLRPDEDQALLKSVRYGRLKLVRLLIEGGADPNIRDSEGRTALIIAVITDFHDSQSAPKNVVIKYLLEHGADVNAHDLRGRTALLYACAYPVPMALVTMLVEYGADPTLTDCTGKDALQHAACTGDKMMVDLLVQAGRARGKSVIVLMPQPPQSQPEGNKTKTSTATGAEGDETEEKVVETYFKKLCAISSSRTHRSSMHTDIDVYCKAMEQEAAEKHRSSSAEGCLDMYADAISSVRPPPGKPARKLIRRYTTNCMVDQADLAEIQARELEEIRQRLLQHERALHGQGLTEAEHNLEESDESINNVTELHPARRPVLGPGNRVLERQGSATRLLDEISHKRPGVLPALNVNLRKPIPSIGEKRRSALAVSGLDRICDEDEVSRDDDVPQQAVIPEKQASPSNDLKPEEESEVPEVSQGEEKILYIDVKTHPHRKFLNDRSRTLQMGEMSRLLTITDKSTVYPDALTFPKPSITT